MFGGLHSRLVALNPHPKPSPPLSHSPRLVADPFPPPGPPQPPEGLGQTY